MTPIKAFCFDVFGTVVDWRSCIARDAAIFFERHGLSRFDPLEFADAWRGRYQPAMQACRAGQRPYVRLAVLHRAHLEYVLGEMEIGRAPCRARVCQSGWIPVVALSLKKKKQY